MLLELVVFMVVVGFLWYVVSANNFLGLGGNKRGKELIKESISFAVVAAIFYLIAYYLLSLWI